jgi:hypothetical protein
MPQAGFEPTEAESCLPTWIWAHALPPSHHGWVVWFVILLSKLHYINNVIIVGHHNGFECNNHGYFRLYTRFYILLGSFRILGIVILGHTEKGLASKVVLCAASWALRSKILNIKIYSNIESLKLSINCDKCVDHHLFISVSVLNCENLTKWQGYEVARTCGCGSSCDPAQQGQGECEGLRGLRGQGQGHLLDLRQGLRVKAGKLSSLVCHLKVHLYEHFEHSFDSIRVKIAELEPLEITYFCQFIIILS